VRAQVPFLLYNVMFTALPIVIFGVVDQVSHSARRSDAAVGEQVHGLTASLTIAMVRLLHCGR
jgi:hypothetical protein